MFLYLISVKNLITNIKTYLRKDGYLICTLLDGELVHKRLEEGKYTSTYTDEDGKRVKLFEIVKKYTGELQDKPGQAVDIHMSWISNEDTYNEEYLISKELMIKTMSLAKCRLVETDLFKNIYHLNKDYFNNVIEFEENPKNKQYFENIKEFFKDLKGADKESKEYSFLNRYYIFQKVE